MVKQPNGQQVVQVWSSGCQTSAVQQLHPGFWLPSDIRTVLCLPQCNATIAKNSLFLCLELSDRKNASFYGRRALSASWHARSITMFICHLCMCVFSGRVWHGTILGLPQQHRYLPLDINQATSYLGTRREGFTVMALPCSYIYFSFSVFLLWNVLYLDKNLCLHKFVLCLCTNTFLLLW